MGINTTPTNHRSFTFDGKSTREFGVYITGEGVFNAPERAVEMISIPGRDGEYALDQGHFNNIEVTYRAGIVADSTTDFAEAISNFRNWLASREGYCRLTDEYNTEEYRMAVFKNAIALEHEGLLTGEFDVTFDCKPQRYLAIGEELTEIGAWGNTETAEGEVVTIDASSDTAVKALTADIDPVQDLHGYDAPWVGGAGKNKLPYPYYETTKTAYGITWTDMGDGQIKVNGTATARTVLFLRSHSETSSIPSGSYILSKGFTSQTVGISIDAYNGNTWVRNIGQTVASDNVPITIDYDGYDRVEIFITVANGAVVNNQVVKPMLRLATVSDTTWTPYENICPISGHTEVDVVRTGKNLLPNIKYQEASTRVQVGSTGDFSIILPAGTYKYSASAVAGATVYWQKQGGVVQNFNNNMVLTETSAVNIWYYKSGGLSTDDIDWFQLELGSTATDYEPYQGQSYTTTLPSTTYGGTLDVVSGLLTVTHWYVDFGDLLWTYSSGNTSFYAGVSGIVVPATAPDRIKGFICSAYPASVNYSIPPDDMSMLNAGGNIWVRNTNYTDAPTFKTAMDGVQLCYELATPQTYQLTPQQIELLLGENHIFADSGNVTVEYGHNPTLLTNPTWFPSKPLLAVEGYGEIKFNNRSIVNIENATLGDIKQLVNESKALSMTTTFDNAMFNVGDTITVDLSYFNYGAYIIMNASTTPTTSGTVTDSDAHFTTVVTDCVADQGISPSPLYVHVKTTCTPITFTLGTPDTVTNTTEAVVDTQGDKCKWTQTVKYEIDGSGNHKISIKQTLVGASGTNVTTATNMNSNPMILCNSVVAHSTLSILGNPTYIDCDIGEAYMETGGSIVSLNQYIDLGSDLPTLPSGDTEVTYDNTITKVEVKPNWWKV